MISIGDRFRVKVLGSKQGITERIYTVDRMTNPFNIWCKVDPPLKGGKDTTFVSETFLTKQAKKL